MQVHPVSFLRTKIASRPFSDPHEWRLAALVGPEKGRVALAGGFSGARIFRPREVKAPGLNPT